VPIRLRIALATAIILALSLLILGYGIYLTMSRNLHDDMDDRIWAVYDAYRDNPGEWYQAPDRIILDTADVDPLASSGLFIQVLAANTELVKKSDNLGRHALPTDLETLQRNARGESVFYNTRLGNRPVRVVSGKIADPFNGNLIAFVQVAESETQINSTLADLRRNLILGSLLTMVALTLGAWLIADAAMRPLARMSQTVRGVGRTGDLSQRLQPPHTRDEVQFLAETFNEMLTRLEVTFNAQRRFLADASHELRTPLTALRANSDIMLRQIESGAYRSEDLLEGLTDIRDEVDRMTRLVQNLLTLARADVGWKPDLEPVDLVEIARSAARIAAPLQRGQRFAIDLPDGENGSDLQVRGNTDQLTQLALILLDNAFNHTPSGSSVTLRVERAGEQASLSVVDTGGGIPTEHQARIFERFYRADEARRRASGGAGLGLSIARWIATVHGATLDVNSAPGMGATFTLRIPLLASNNQPERRSPVERPATLSRS
jgi:signal transduction histidine kinase